MRKKYLPFVFLFLIFLLVIIFINTSPTAFDKNTSYLSKNQFIETDPFFEKKLFYDGVKRSEKSKISIRREIFGGVVPHHLLPSFIIADFFNILSKSPPKTIILIGPNHFEKGKGKVIIGSYSFNTPFGISLIDDKLGSLLIKNNVGIVDNTTIKNEHSILGLIPFIKYYLPKTKVVPLILSSSVNLEDTEKISEILKKYVNNNEAIIVSSVDFSHYLINEEAKKRDKITIDIIKKWDFRSLFNLNNDYLDSPPSLAVLLLTMKKIEANDIFIIHNTNSGEIVKNNTIETTSYFSIILSK